MDNAVYLGHYVIFTDESGTEIAGRVLVLDPFGWVGKLGIEGDHGVYSRNPDEVRLAERWEVHAWEINGSLR